jgi:fucose 4-O-acetylase-like acetyltransferase
MDDKISASFSMEASQRDIALDFLKGVGCVLMILAHSQLITKVGDGFTFVGGLAPIAFFSVSGIVAGLQAKNNKPTLPVLAQYLLLFLIGYSHNGMGYEDFLHDTSFNILQTISLGSAIVFLMEKNIRIKPWAYFVLALFSFALKEMIVSFSFLRNITVLNGTLLPGGFFPLIPWISIFFYGVFCYRTNNQNNLRWSFIFLIIFAFCQYSGFDSNPTDKWGFSLGYFLITSAIQFAVFYLIRKVAWFRSAENKAIILFLGKNSLLFLYLHVAIINTVYYYKGLKKIHWTGGAPFLLWAGVLAVTILLMWILLKFQPMEKIRQIFGYWFIWVGMALLVFVTPLIVKNNQLLFLVELALGIILSLYYPLISTAFKRFSRASVFSDHP